VTAPISFSARFTLTLEAGASLLLEIFSAYFGTIRRRTYYKTAAKTAIVWASSKKEVLQRLAAHAEKHPILEKKRRLKF